MADNPRHHLMPSDHQGDIPRHLTKQEFARRLSAALLERTWTQAELGRAAGLPRDTIGTYVRGRSLPTPVNLKRIADALSMEVHDLLPNSFENAVDNDIPAFEMRESVGHPGQVWVRLNRRMTFRQGLAIARILDEIDKADTVVGHPDDARREEQDELPLEE